MTHLYVFGDSITQGAWDPMGGWVQRVRCTIDKSYMDGIGQYCLTFNMGVSGNTTHNLIQRFTPEMTARHNTEDENILLIDIGINDSIFDYGDNVSRYTLDEFEQNLENLLAQAHAFSKKIGFLGIVPVDESLVNPLPWSTSEAYNNKNAAAFNARLTEFCAKHDDVINVDIWDDWFIDNKDQYKNWLFDGVHPNASGHRRIAEAVIKQFLKPLGFDIKPEDAGGYLGLT